LKPAWANSSQGTVSKNPSQKRAGGVTQGIDPEFKPQYHKKKRNELYETKTLLSSLYSGPCLAQGLA
jgi:hypothetical protein